MQLFAPFIPHITEEIYQVLYSTESVHRRGNWPKIQNSSLSVDLVQADKVIEILDLVRKAKAEKNLSVKAEIKLLEIIKSVPRQFIIFTQFDNIIKKIIRILEKEDIYSNSFSASNVESFKNKELQILILSSKDEACGIDLSFVSDIIIFEPIYYPERVSNIGNYVKDVEKQIVGRIYRINQISECNVHRLMIKDTIEEQIYRDL